MTIRRDRPLTTEAKQMLDRVADEILALAPDGNLPQRWLTYLRGELRRYGAKPGRPEENSRRDHNIIREYTAFCQAQESGKDKRTLLQFQKDMGAKYNLKARRIEGIIRASKKDGFLAIQKRQHDKFLTQQKKALRS